MSCTQALRLKSWVWSGEKGDFSLFLCVPRVPLVLGIASLQWVSLQLFIKYFRRHTVQPSQKTEDLHSLKIFQAVFCFAHCNYTRRWYQLTAEAAIYCPVRQPDLTSQRRMAPSSSALFLYLPSTKHFCLTSTSIDLYLLCSSSTFRAMPLGA